LSKPKICAKQYATSLERKTRGMSKESMNEEK
jgi:hypothetical protein